MKNMFLFKFIVFILSGCLLAGCQPLRKKFTREKKDTGPLPVYYASRDYAGKSNLEIYQKHYIYWQAWHNEIIDRFGDNKKKMLAASSGAAMSLRRMQELLRPEKAELLTPYIDRMSDIAEKIRQNNIASVLNVRVKRDLDRDLRYIKREFYYKHVFDDIIESTDEYAKDQNDV